MLGLWRFLKRSEEFKVPIAYADETRAVVVPQELELPLVLARALSLSSGLAPELLTAAQYAAYADPTNGFTPGPAYQGYCLSYPNVPRRIAETVLEKLGALPTLYPPLPPLEFQTK
jgi:hypothetical protein